MDDRIPVNCISMREKSARSSAGRQPNKRHAVDPSLVEGVLIAAAYVGAAALWMFLRDRGQQLLQVLQLQVLPAAQQRQQVEGPPPGEQRLQQVEGEQRLQGEQLLQRVSSSCGSRFSSCRRSCNTRACSLQT